MLIHEAVFCLCYSASYWSASEGVVLRRVSVTWEYMPSGLLLSRKKSAALLVILHLLHTFATSAAEAARCACRLPGCASPGFRPRAMWLTCTVMHPIMTSHAAVPSVFMSPCCGVLHSECQAHNKLQQVANEVAVHCLGLYLVPLQFSMLHWGVF